MQVIRAHESALGSLEEGHRCCSHGLLELHLGASLLLVIVASLGQVGIARPIDAHFVHQGRLGTLRAAHATRAEARRICLIETAGKSASEALHVHVILEALLCLLVSVLALDPRDKYSFIVWLVA